MAEKKKTEYLKEFVKFREEAAKMSQLEEAAFKHKSTDVKSALQSQYYALAREFAKKYGEEVNFDAALQILQRDPLNKDANTLVSGIYQHGKEDFESDSYDRLFRNLDDILEEVDHNTLDYLMKTESKEKPFLRLTQKGDEEIVQRYLNYNDIKVKREKIKADELDEKEEKKLKEEVAQLYAKQQITERMRKDAERGLLKDQKYYSTRESWIRSAATLLGYKNPNKFKEIADKSLGEIEKALKKEYDTYTEENKRDIYDIAKDSIRSFVAQSTSNPKEFEYIAARLSDAYKATREK